MDFNHEQEKTTKKKKKTKQTKNKQTAINKVKFRTIGFAEILRGKVL